jgi:hypothetical protein
VDSSKNEVAFLNPRSGDLVNILPGQNVAAAEEGTLAVSRGSKVVFLNPLTLAEIDHVNCEAAIGSQPALSPEGKFLAFRRGNRASACLVILDVLQKREVRVIEASSEWGPLSFARGGTRLVAANWNEDVIRVWDTVGWSQLAIFRDIHGVTAGD